MIRARSFQTTRCSGLKSKTKAGFSILEVLLGVVLASITLAGVATLFTRTLDISSRADNQNAVEAAVSADLNWIKRYGKFWMMQSGPYALNNSFTKTTSAFTSSPVLSYQCPNSDLTTTNLSTQFITAANSITNLTDIDPKLGYVFSTNTIPVPSTPYTLTRTLTTPTATQVLVTYNLTGADAASLAFSRQTTILLEAAAWCTEVS
ncbi:hypothetical protein Cyagr_1413 [Cyanobium gracile PCC 6307]|uniref:Prepilin-type N-terminal cleavage/methylation domain-containing protein n=1 Tax=Cyanobium gracile (strain ATCC 27147 / PCC 6307) TaxID=292564 RepID=K9P775_CYAGP|nr:hypothetical protein Cyagr_1413 [Cyanobium gracile PCC 6307]